MTPSRQGDNEPRLTPEECRALRLAVVFGKPDNPRHLPDHLGSAVEKLHRMENAASPVEATLHRAVVTFDDGVYVKLICPESGCVSYVQCGRCAADLTDPASERCYDCEGVKPGECWIKSWFDNLPADELLYGSVMVEIDAVWESDHIEASIVRAVDVTEGAP